MIPAVRALLSTSYDPKIRRALAEKKARAANATGNAGRRSALDPGGKETAIGTMVNEAEEAATDEGIHHRDVEGAASGDVGGGGGDDGGAVGD